MGEVKLQTVSMDEDGIRLDRWFKRHYPETNHHTIEKLLRTGQIRVDGKRRKANFRISDGQEIRVPPGLSQQRPRELPRHSPKDQSKLEEMLLFQDEDILVFNKPSGLAVQGGTRTQTHLDAMLKSFQIRGEAPPKLTHRLDKDTSGVLVVGRNSFAASRLAAAFRTRAVQKLYWGLCFGVPRPAEGMISSAITKAGGKPAEQAKVAQTRYRVLSSIGQEFAWLSLEPKTGRTHQIRIHCQELGHALVGDQKYRALKDLTAETDIANKLHLHARLIRFQHPRSGRAMQFSAPLGGHMKQTWKLLELQSPTADEFLEVLD